MSLRKRRVAKLRVPAVKHGIIVTPKYLFATAILVLVPSVLAEFISKELGVAMLVMFIVFSMFGRTVGRQTKAKWKAAASQWPKQLPAPHVLERTHLINRDKLKLRRFTIRAQNPKAACILVHGYAQSAHFEFLAATYPGGPHSKWEDSILQTLADAGVSCYAMDLQGHGESEGARGLRGYFETFDDLAADLIQLHGQVQAETHHALPIFWLGTSMGGAVACRALQLQPSLSDVGLIMLAPMVSLGKVAEKSVAGPIKNKHLVPVAGLLSLLLPTLPLIKKSDSVLAQQLDAEFRSDTTNYTGSVRVRVAYHFNTLCRGFLKPTGDKSLEKVACRALLALHANADTMTEPDGSEQLCARATSARKTLVLISGPDGQAGRMCTYSDGEMREGLGGGGGGGGGRRGSGGSGRGGGGEGAGGSSALAPGGKAQKALTQLHGLNMWHSITTEPGCEKVSLAVASWIVEEAARYPHQQSAAARAASPAASRPRRQRASPARRSR